MQKLPQSRYMAERVLTASPLELIRMLYEEALSSVEVAIDMLRANDILARGRAITKAVNILGELRASLRPGSEGEFTSTVSELYGYMQRRLFEAHARKSEERLREVSRLLKCLYEGWLGVMKNLAEAQADAELTSEGTGFGPANPYETMLSSTASCRSWQI